MASRPVTLGSVEQDILARWGAKTVYTLLAASIPEFHTVVPDTHRRTLRETGSVHPLTWVGYASWRGEPTLLTGKDMRDDIPHSYGVLLAFTGVALKVFGIHAPVPGHSLTLNDDRIRQVAPRLQRPIAWPLAQPFNQGEYQALMDDLPLTRGSRIIVARAASAQ